jgi:hypothetical protein
MTTESTHTVNYERVVRFAGERHFGYVVTCSCGFKCEKHYAGTAAAKCANDHAGKSGEAQA